MESKKKKETGARDRPRLPQVCLGSPKISPLKIWLWSETFKVTLLPKSELQLVHRRLEWLAEEG